MWPTSIGTGAYFFRFYMHPGVQDDIKCLARETISPFRLHSFAPILHKASVPPEAM